MNIYEQILAGLKTKFQGVEDATLQRIASKKAEGVTDESKVNSIVEGISFQDVLTSYGDYRADGAQKTAVSNYEKKHNIKDGKPIEEPKPQDPLPTPAPQPTEQVPAWAQSLIDSNKTLSEKLAAMDAKTKADERNQQIAAVAKSFGIPEYVYKGKQIADDVDLNQYFTDVKQEMQNGGFQFAKSPEEGNHEHKDDMDSLLDSVNKRTEAIKTENEKK
jgi:hypothetical protein|nr:MAG TPA: hypothetical protein [Caudoviricetes sp.]